MAVWHDCLLELLVLTLAVIDFGIYIFGWIDWLVYSYIDIDGGICDIFLTLTYTCIFDAHIYKWCEWQWFQNPCVYKAFCQWQELSWQQDNKVIIVENEIILSYWEVWWDEVSYDNFKINCIVALKGDFMLVK